MLRPFIRLRKLFPTTLISLWNSFAQRPGSQLWRSRNKIALQRKLTSRRAVTPNYPQENDKAEMLIQTLLNMTGTLKMEQESNWKAHIVHAYTCTRHKSTGLSPYTPGPTCPKDRSCVSGLKEKLQLAYKASHRQASRPKEMYGRLVRNVKVVAGDRI